MIWDDDDANDYRVVDREGWYSLKHCDEAPSRAGVYIFASRDGHVKYVGKAGAGRLRDEIYNAIYRGKGHGATIYAWLATNSNEYAKSLEQDLIDEYDPINNLL